MAFSSSGALNSPSEESFDSTNVLAYCVIFFTTLILLRLLLMVVAVFFVFLHRPTFPISEVNLGQVGSLRDNLLWCK